MAKDNLENITDQELLERFYSNRDNQWLGILLQRYTLLLLGVCMKYLKNESDAKDSVQQIFLKAITELHKYKVEYIKSWLYMIARNYCLMKIRDSNGKIPGQLREEMISMPEESRIDHREKEKIFDMLESCLPELAEEQKTCVTLFYLQKKSYKDICEQTGFSQLQVKSYIQNGKRNLKILIEKKLKTNNG